MANELQTKLDAILNDKNTNLLPENLKAGVTCLGVTGTLEEGSTETDSVKLFETVEEMNSSTGNKEGDLAVIYRSEIQPLTADSVVSGLSFKSTVVLDEAITTSGYAYLMDENQSYETQCQLRYSSTYFYIRDYYTYEYIVRYTSADGITYTLDSGYETSYTFNQPMYFKGTWNNIYGEFIQCGGMSLEGLYQYTTKQDPNYLALYKMTKQDDGWKGYGSELVSISDGPTHETIRSLLEKTSGKTVSDYDGYKIADNIYRIILSNVNSSSKLSDNRFIFDGTNLYAGISPYSGTFIAYQFDVDLNSNTCTQTQLDVSNLPTLEHGGNTTQYYEKIDTGLAFSTSGNIECVVAYTDTSTADMSWVNTDYEFPIVNISKYRLAPTQLNTTPDCVYEKEFYGKNGVELGTLQNTENLTKEQALLRLELADKFKTMSLTGDCNAMFANSTKTEIDVSGLDTTNVTSMNSMFMECNNITHLDVSTFNTSNVTTMGNFCYDCDNLEELICTGLDFSKVTSMNYSFACNPKLKKLDLSGCVGRPTNTYGMFRANESLEYLDVSSLDFTASTYYGDMFTSYSSGAVPDNCLIYVKDQANKDWLLARKSTFTNIQIKS